jgi:hypothetical protein
VSRDDLAEQVAAMLQVTAALRSAVESLGSFLGEDSSVMRIEDSVLQTWRQYRRRPDTRNRRKLKRALLNWERWLNASAPRGDPRLLVE